MEREESSPGIEKCFQERGEAWCAPFRTHSWMEPAEPPPLAGPGLSLAAGMWKILIPTLEWTRSAGFGST